MNLPARSFALSILTFRGVDIIANRVFYRGYCSVNVSRIAGHSHPWESGT